MNKHWIALTILTIVVFTSCKKETTEPASSLQSLQNASVNSAIAEQNSPTFTVVDNSDGTHTATLQPDATNGQDVHVYKRNGSPEVANENFNTVPELDISAWTYNGSPIFLRVYLRFDDLAKIPSTAHVLSATLYLYGLSSSITSPQGNYGDNRCIIEPATGPWDESTLTWNTQPKASDRFHVTIPASTSQWNYDVALDDVKAMVTRAVKYPDRNFGVRISLAEESYYQNMVFASSESSDPTKRPKLVVVYE
jgi:hypothetical protein